MIRTLNKLEALLAAQRMQEGEVIFFDEFTPFHARCVHSRYFIIGLNLAERIRLGRLEGFSTSECNMACCGCGCMLKNHP